MSIHISSRIAIRLRFSLGFVYVSPSVWTLRESHRSAAVRSTGPRNHRDEAQWRVRQSLAAASAIIGDLGQWERPRGKPVPRAPIGMKLVQSGCRVRGRLAAARLQRSASGLSPLPTQSQSSPIDYTASCVGLLWGILLRMYVNVPSLGAPNSAASLDH
jgi:hypothetical protein